MAKKKKKVSKKKKTVRKAKKKKVFKKKTSAKKAKKTKTNSKKQSTKSNNKIFKVPSDWGKKAYIDKKVMKKNILNLLMIMTPFGLKKVRELIG